jgi:hypothetical protein
MAERDRQNLYRNEEQDWRERDRSRLREDQSATWAGQSQSRWAPEGGYALQGGYGGRQYSHRRGQQAGYGGHPSNSRYGGDEYSGYQGNEFERRAQDDYILGEQHGPYGGQHANYGGYGSQPTGGGAWQSRYEPSHHASGYAGHSSQTGYGARPQSGYGTGPQGRMHRRGPKGYKRSDERIREDVCDRLMQSDVDASEVTVDVRDGNVILEGSVPERRMKYVIEDIAEQCLGVTDVENKLRVSREDYTSRTGGAESAEVDGLNRCLRSELSAVETYRQALDRDRQQYGAHDEFQRLSEILREHEDSASQLRHAILSVGGEPSTDSGAWGTWSKFIMGTAKLFGDKPALKALKEGEESGFKEFDRFQRESHPSAEARNLTSELMGRQQRHMRELDSLIAAAERT